MPIAQNSATMMPMPMPNPDAGFGWLAGQGRPQMSFWQQLSATGSPPEETPACEGTGGKKRGKRPMDRQETPCASSEGGREVAPGGRFSARPTDGSVPKRNRGWVLGWKNVSRNARATSRVIASARRRRDRSRCRARTLRRRARLERVTSSALATERDRDGPRETKSRPWNRIDETYQSFEEPFDGLVGQASGVRALRECEGHEGHEKDHGGSAHGYVRRDECASEARGGGVQT
jgi:hypothetical protein